MSVIIHTYQSVFEGFKVSNKERKLYLSTPGFMPTCANRHLNKEINGKLHFDSIARLPLFFSIGRFLQNLLWQLYNLFKKIMKKKHVSEGVEVMRFNANLCHYS